MPRQFWTEPLAWSTVSGTAITNTTTETVLFNNVTIPANWLQDSRVVQLIVMGQISNVITAAPTITFRVRWGGVAGTVLAASAALACSASAFTNAMFRMVVEIQSRSNGATGTVMAMGEVSIGNNNTGTFPNPNFMGSAGALSPAAVTIDMTGDTALSVTAAWGTANAANSIQGINYILQVFN